MNFSLPAFLEITIGLVFIYLILSLLASEIQELFAGFWQWRAKHLKESIYLMLGGEIKKNAQGTQAIESENKLQEQLLKTESEQNDIFKLIDKLYEHYEISSLKQSSLGFNIFKAPNGSEKFGPSYIPPESFAEAFIDILAEKYNGYKLDDDLIERLQILIPGLGKKIEVLRIITSYSTQKTLEEIQLEETQVNSENFKQSFTENFTDSLKKTFHLSEKLESDKLKSYIIKSIEKVLEETQPSGENFKQSFTENFTDSFADEYNKHNKLPEHLETSIKRLLNKVTIKGANSDSSINLFKKEIATWFQRSQERTSGTYKRNSKIVLFFVGFLAAILANADTFHIIENLHDESVREAIVTQASNTVTECQGKSEEKLLTCLKEQVDPALKFNDLPIGWSIFLEETQKSTSNPSIKFLSYIGKNLPGYTVTALAIMMGAPFWFDLLKKLVNVRNAGPKPKSSSSSSEATTININTEK